MIGTATAKLLTYIGAATSVLCALPLLHIFFAGTGQVIAVIPMIIALLLGGAAFLYGKRAGTVVLAAFILAMRLWEGRIISSATLSVDFLIIIGIGLGLMGVFASHRHALLAQGHKAAKYIDTNLAASFVRISGAAGLSFGPLLWMFSMAEMGGFTALNSTNALLIILFAWQTLKRQLWAAVAQAILAVGTLTFAYANPAGQISVFGFFPIFLLLLHVLGVVGVTNLKKAGRRKEDTVG